MVTARHTKEAAIMMDGQVKSINPISVAGESCGNCLLIAQLFSMNGLACHPLPALRCSASTAFAFIASMAS